MTLTTIAIGIEPEVLDPRFPNDAIFTQLVRLSKEIQGSVIFDSARGVSVGYTQLLQDILQFQICIRNQLPPELLDSNGYVREEEIYICILAPASYEFLVALFAVIALGAAAVPISPKALPGESVYYIEVCNAVCMVALPKLYDLATEVQDEVRERLARNIPLISIEVDSKKVFMGSSFTVHERLTFPSSRPAVLLFTSGTTGLPKPIVHSRDFLHTAPLSYRERHGLNKEDFFLHAHPATWLAGFRNLIIPVLSGVRIEFMDNSSPVLFWKRIRKADLTMFFGWPSLWLQMMRHYEKQIFQLPHKERQLYIDGAKRLRIAISSGGLIVPSVQRFWQQLRGGCPLIVSYTTTELGMTVIETAQDEKEIIAGSIGYPVPGVKVKLSNGDHGQLLVRTPIESWYLNISARNKSTYDSEGYHRTGDLAHFCGNKLIIDGRANTDIIRFQGLKVSALEVEAGLLELPYISQAVVVPVPDPENGDRVAAIVWASESHDVVTFEMLRNDLAHFLPQYKLPTLLRVLSDSDTLPKTRSNKVIREKARKAFFPKSPEAMIRTLPAEVHIWDVNGWNDTWKRRDWDFWE